MTTPVRLSAPFTLPRAYVHCTRKPGSDSFGQFAYRLRDAPGWRFHEMDASHNPHITAPEELAGLLDSIAGEFAP
jgi:hypothetical protein